MAAELGLLNKDVALTAELLGRLYDGLCEISSEPRTDRTENHSTERHRLPLYGLPSQSTTLPRRD